MKKLLLVIFVGLSLAGSVLAHQPRIVQGGLTEIINPDVSQAFYGNLEGEPDFFRINLEEPSKIYFNILVPDLKDINKNLIVTILSDNGYSYILDGIAYDWTYFYEEFAGDHYYKGPEAELDLEKGTYNIKVLNPENQGKYVLVVGQKEEFPIGEIINTIVILPQLKKNFFERSPFSAFFNLISLFIYGPIILIIVLILLRKKIKALMLWKIKLIKNTFNFLFKRK
jgi:hypothetical protein